MPEKQYTYAVARIRSKEMQLLDTQFLEQMMAAESYEECLRLLLDKGWGQEGQTEPEQILAYELEKTWAYMAELVEDMSVFDVLLLQNDYHNLKTVLKQVYINSASDGLFISRGTVQSQRITEAIETRKFELLPEHMRMAAQEAYETLIQTGDGQLCDLIIDKAAMEALYAAGRNQTNEVLKTVAELKIAASNIRIAVRGQKTGKPLEWIKRAMAPCDSLDIERLSNAAAIGLNEIYEVLSHTIYEEGVNELKHSLSLFETWCDNLLIRKIQPQKYNPFTIGPLAAYLLASENEQRMVRLILLGKRNQLSEESIRERLRIMYV